MKRTFRILALAAVCFLSLSPHLEAANSPVGVWDFVITGKERGAAVISFSNNFTLGGSQVIRPAPPATTSPAPARGGDASRSGTSGTTSTNPASAGTNVLGGARLQGMWTFNSAGKIIGTLEEVTSIASNFPVYITNMIVDEMLMITNLVISTNMMLTNISSTNGTSFSGLVRSPGTSSARFTLCRYSGRGTATFSGVPHAALVDLDGVIFSGFGVRNGLPFVEFLEFQRSLGSDNSYYIDGLGAGYTFHGFAILTRQKVLSLYTSNDDSETPVFRSYGGNFNLTSKAGSLNGTDLGNSKITYRIEALPAP